MRVLGKGWRPPRKDRRSDVPSWVVDVFFTEGNTTQAELFCKSAAVSSRAPSAQPTNTKAACADPMTHFNEKGDSAAPLCPSYLSDWDFVRLLQQRDARLKASLARADSDLCASLGRGLSRPPFPSPSSAPLRTVADPSAAAVQEERAEGNTTAEVECRPGPIKMGGKTELQGIPPSASPKDPASPDRDLLIFGGSLDIPSIQQEIPSIQQEIPSVQQEIPSVQQEIPSVQQEIPSVQQEIPSVEHAFSVDPSPFPLTASLLSNRGTEGSLGRCELSAAVCVQTAWRKYVREWEALCLPRFCTSPGRRERSDINGFVVWNSGEEEFEKTISQALDVLCQMGRGRGSVPPVRGRMVLGLLRKVICLGRTLEADGRWMEVERVERRLQKAILEAQKQLPDPERPLMADSFTEIGSAQESTVGASGSNPLEGGGGKKKNKKKKTKKTEDDTTPSPCASAPLCPSPSEGILKSADTGGKAKRKRKKKKKTKKAKTGSTLASPSLSSSGTTGVCVPVFEEPPDGFEVGFSLMVETEEGHSVDFEEFLHPPLEKTATKKGQQKTKGREGGKPEPSVLKNGCS